MSHTLTLIVGPKCNLWTKKIQDQLCLKVLGDPATQRPPTHAENDPALWEWFVTKFKDQFGDPAEEENTYAALKRLELENNDADVKTYCLLCAAVRLMQDKDKGTEGS